MKLLLRSKRESIAQVIIMCRSEKELNKKLDLTYFVLFSNCYGGEIFWVCFTDKTKNFVFLGRKLRLYQ